MRLKASKEKAVKAAEDVKTTEDVKTADESKPIIKTQQPLRTASVFTLNQKEKQEEQPLYRHLMAI